MTAATAHEFDLSGTSPVPLSRLVAVELRKMTDTRASRWLLACAFGLGAVAQVIALVTVLVVDESLAFGDFVFAFAFVSSVLLPVVGIMLVTSEWAQRTAMTTFTLEPRRLLVILAKLVAGLVLTLITVGIALATGALCSLVLGLTQDGADWHLGLRGVLAFALTQLLAMAGGFALACLVLNTPFAIVLFFVYKWALPGLFALGSALIGWFADLTPWIDFQAAQEFLYEGSATGRDWAHLIVSGCVWLVLPLGLGLWRILRAEVK